jgi:transposase
MQIHTIGIDLGKTVFHLVGLNLCGEAVVRRKCSRTQLLQFTANVQVDLIGIEACAGAHFWEERSASKGIRCGSSQLSTSSRT